MSSICAPAAIYMRGKGLQKQEKKWGGELNFKRIPLHRVIGVKYGNKINLIGG